MTKNYEPNESDTVKTCALEAPAGTDDAGRGTFLSDAIDYSHHAKGVNRHYRIIKGDIVNLCKACGENEVRYGRTVCESCLSLTKKRIFKGIKR